MGFLTESVALLKCTGAGIDVLFLHNRIVMFGLCFVLWLVLSVLGYMTGHNSDK